MPHTPVGLKTPVTPGVKTVVSPKSEKNLPSGIDREKEQALPSGAATPNSPSESGGGGGGGGREFPRTEYNTPDADSQISERPRTLPTPGGEYGHPVKEDYGYVTRRDMTAMAYFVAAEVLGEDTLKEGRWQPGKRQTKQKGTDKFKRKKQYRKNRNKAKMRSRLYYRRNKNKAPFKRVQNHRRKYPHQHRRRFASILNVVAMYLDNMVVADNDWNPPKSVPPSDRQKKQRGTEKSKSKAEYRKNRVQKNREMQKRHEVLQPKGQYQKYKKWYNEQYADRGAFRRRGEVLTSPQITFGIGPNMVPGTVHSLSPMSGMVTFVIHQKDFEPLQSMPVMAFLQSVVFASDADIDAFYELVDVEIGEEAYEDLDEDIVQECASLYEVDTGSPEFADQCESLVGERFLDRMTVEQLETVTDTLVLQILEGGGMQRSMRPDEMDADDERYDHNLYYGEVDPEDPFGKDATEGITFTREQESPVPETDQADSYPTNNTHSPGVGPGTGYNRHQDDASPASGRVVPNGEGQFWQGEETYVKAAGGKVAETIRQLMENTEQKVHQRAKKVSIKLKRADPAGGIWTFSAAGSKGASYIIRIKGERRGNLKDLAKAQVEVSCSCPYFRWWGPEHWGKTNDYMYGKTQGIASVPVIRDPDSVRWVCKHTIAALMLAQNYRFGSEHQFSVGAGVAPTKDSLTRVVDAWLQGNNLSIPYLG